MSQRLQGLLLLAVAMAAVGVAVVVVLLAPKPSLTGCMGHERSPGQTFVLVDHTDPLEKDQFDELVAIAADAAGRLEKNAKLSIFLVNGAVEYPPKSHFSLCNPGRDDQINPLYETSTFDRFVKSLKAVLEELRGPHSEDYSPIMETIASVSRLDDFATGRRELDIYSDMLENMPPPMFSQYQGPGDFAKFQASDEFRRYRAHLSGVSVRYFVIARPQTSALQTEKLFDFWNRYFVASGAKDVSICTIDTAAPRQSEVRCATGST